MNPFRSSNWPPATKLSSTGDAGGHVDRDGHFVRGFVDRRAMRTARKTPFGALFPERATLHADFEGLRVETERGTIFLSSPTHHIERRHPKLKFTHEPEYLVHGHADGPFVIFLADRHLAFRKRHIYDLARPHSSAEAAATQRVFERVLSRYGLLVEGHAGVEADPVHAIVRRMDRIYGRAVIGGVTALVLTPLPMIVVGLMVDAYGPDAVSPGESTAWTLMAITMLTVLPPCFFVLGSKSGRVFSQWQSEPLPHERSHWVDGLPDWTAWIVPAIFVLSLLGMIYGFVFLGDVISGEAR